MLSPQGRILSPKTFFGFQSSLSSLQFYTGVDNSQLISLHMLISRNMIWRTIYILYMYIYIHIYNTENVYAISLCLYICYISYTDLHRRVSQSMESPLSTLKLCFTLSSVRSRQSELNWEGRVGPDTFALCEVSQSVTITTRCTKCN